MGLRQRLAGDDGLRILEGRPGDAAEVGHPEIGPSADGQVLAAVNGLVGDGRKANGAVLWSPGVEVSSLDVPDPRGVGGHRVEVGVAEADGVAAPAVEMLEDEAGVACAEEVAPDPEADRRREARPVSQKVVDDLGVGLTARPLQAGDIVAVS